MTPSNCPRRLRAASALAVLAAPAVVLPAASTWAQSDSADTFAIKSGGQIADCGDRVAGGMRAAAAKTKNLMFALVPKP